MASIWMKSATAVGFSKGWAALALKNPPPLVPSILMITCEATGPTAMVWIAPSGVTAANEAAKVCTMPWPTSSSAPGTHSGSSTYRVARTRSVQKLPMPCASARAMPRATAMHAAMPTAAETKFW